MTFRMPAEWAPHDWTWIGFPTNPAEWPGAFDGARQQIAAFTNALHCGGKGEQVRLALGRQSLETDIRPTVGIPPATRRRLALHARRAADGSALRQPDACLRGAGRQVTAIGIAFDGQLVDKVPVGPYDAALDAVLTPSGLRPADNQQPGGA